MSDSGKKLGDEPERQFGDVVVVSVTLGSHWNGCWKSSSHHRCAVKEIERLTLRIAELEGLGPRLDAFVREYEPETGG